MTAAPDERDQQAAHWYLKLREANVSAEEIQAGLDWIEACPENRAAFERIETYSSAWPSPLPAGVALPPREVSPARMSLKPRAIAAAAALAVAALLAWFAPNLWHSKGAGTEYVTAIGEHRTVVLEDASQIVLGGATDMRSNLTAESRRVELRGGEALFKVTSNPQRPFVVELPNGSARALGTTFNIHHGPDGTTIAVLDGIVRVDPRRGEDGTQLSAGDQVLLSTDGRMGAVTHADPRRVVAWNHGRLVFVDRSLRSVIADLNRYSTKPITLETTSTGDTHVTGTVKLDAVKQWLEALHSIAGVRLVENEREFVLVAAKSTEAAGPP